MYSLKPFTYQKVKQSFYCNDKNFSYKTFNVWIETEMGFSCEYSQKWKIIHIHPRVCSLELLGITLNCPKRSRQMTNLLDYEILTIIS